MIVISYHFVMIFDNYHLSLHQQTMIFASKVTKEIQKNKYQASYRFLYEVNEDDKATIVH